MAVGGNKLNEKHSGCFLTTKQSDDEIIALKILRKLYVQSENVANIHTYVHSKNFTRTYGRYVLTKGSMRRSFEDSVQE